MKYLFVVLSMSLILYSKEYKNDYDIIEDKIIYLLGLYTEEEIRESGPWSFRDFIYYDQIFEDRFKDTIYITIGGREEIEDHYYVATRDSVLIDKSIVIDPRLGTYHERLKFIPENNNRILYVNCKGIREVMFEIPEHHNHVYVRFYENVAKDKTINRYKLKMKYSNKPFVFR